PPNPPRQIRRAGTGEGIAVGPAVVALFSGIRLPVAATRHPGGEGIADALAGFAGIAPRAPLAVVPPPRVVGLRVAVAAVVTGASEGAWVADVACAGGIRRLE